LRNRFRTVNVVFNILGSLFLVLGVFLLTPLIVFFATREYSRGMGVFFAFITSALISFLLGTLLKFVCTPGNPDRLQAILVCSLTWIGFSAIGALPFVLGLRITYLNGFFEAMSGFTTTGITMFQGLDNMPGSILFWRSLTQWIGGLGILTFFLAVTYRGGSAHMLFGAESHKIGMERPVPGLANTLKILWSIYAGFTILTCVCLAIAGMPFFDSIIHSFTAVATGGFSNHDASIAYYQLTGFRHYVVIEYILILGMLFGGTNFLIHYRIVRRDWKALFDNTEIRYWWGLILFFLIIIFIERSAKLAPFSYISSNGVICWKGVEETFRKVFFQVVAIITTTGFSTEDIGGSFFGHLARQLFLVMMVIGGCVGSTSGGFKVLRVAILTKLIKRELFRMRAPSSALSPVVVDGEVISENELYRVAALFFTWVVLLVFGGAVTALLSDLNAFQSFSGMFSALGNIGPTYIPADTMIHLHPLIKTVFIFGMLAGRLEILPILLLFSTKAWR